MKILLSPDPAEGGEKPPLAAAILANPAVKETDASEIVKLRGELSAHEKKLKERETRLAELEDENRALKTPKPKPEPAPEKKKFLEGDSLGFGFF